MFEPFSNTLKFVSIQHELGMAIGTALRLRPMLLAFSRVCLRRLGLAAVHFHFHLQVDGSVQLHADPGSPQAEFSHYLSLPLHSAVAVPPSFDPRSGGMVECVHRQLADGDAHTYAFNLGTFGVVTLHRIKGQLINPSSSCSSP